MIELRVNKVMKIVINESYKVEKGTKLYAILIRLYMMTAKNQSSWGERFNTTAYQRKVKHINKLWQFAHAVVRKDISDYYWMGWDIERTGSHSRTDVAVGINQKFKVNRVQ
tara:strand:- start:620 stop:952 length:333 start_codon:yes stop_codon:yes gene_type:complete